MFGLNKKKKLILSIPKLSKEKNFFILLKINFFNIFFILHYYFS